MLCKDWIIQPGESLDGHNLEDLVASHYEDFHTIEEIESVRCSDSLCDSDYQ